MLTLNWRVSALDQYEQLLVNTIMLVGELYGINLAILRFNENCSVYVRCYAFQHISRGNRFTVNATVIGAKDGTKDASFPTSAVGGCHRLPNS